MVAPDELQARQLLLAMQERLSRDPFEALGLTNSERADVRTAFLALTKIYHPARFARMAPDIQRLSNEVFLALRAAHDALTRAQVKPPAARSTSTGVIPTFRPPGSTGHPPTGAIPIVRPSPTAPPRPGAVAAPTTGQGSGPVARPPVSPARGVTPATGVPTAPRGGTPRTGVPTTSRPRSPQSQTTQSMRPPGSSAPNDPSRPTRMPSSSPPPSTIASSAAGALPAGAPGGGDPELAGIHELLAQDRLTDARMKLETLVARQPNVPRYQALIHYAKGREAQLARRIDEARVELMDALQLDPDLQIAKTAQAELFTRRK